MSAPSNVGDYPHLYTGEDLPVTVRPVVSYDPCVFGDSIDRERVAINASVFFDSRAASRHGSRLDAFETVAILLLSRFCVSVIKRNVFVVCSLYATATIPASFRVVHGACVCLHMYASLCACVCAPV